jgi:hypothetical protein
MRVTIRGRVARVDSLPIEGVPFIENYCSSDFILYGNDIRPAE